MPDFHAHNMITERQVVNYGGTTSAAEAFFKVFFLSLVQHDMHKNIPQEPSRKIF